MGFQLWVGRTSVHEKKSMVTVPEVEEIPHSYNTRKGVAYYFTQSGNQLI